MEEDLQNNQLQSKSVTITSGSPHSQSLKAKGGRGEGGQGGSIPQLSTGKVNHKTVKR